MTQPIKTRQTNQLTYTLRKLLRPWWGKVGAVIIICMIPILLYATNIYLGYRYEQEWLKPNSKRITVGRNFNVLPQWLKDFPVIYQYGYRFTKLTIKANFTEDPEKPAHQSWVDISNLQHVKTAIIGGFRKENLQYIVKMPNLESLFILFSDIDDDSVDILRKMKNLRVLVLQNSSLSQDGLIKLKKMQEEFQNRYWQSKLNAIPVPTKSTP